MHEHNDPPDYRYLYLVAGTPKDYSNSIYQFYIELAEITELTDELVTSRLDHSEYCQVISKTPTSYLLHACIQDIPDLIRDFGANNIAVYQVIRIAKILSLP
ncbi:MAG: hypothetical protein EOO09_21415 [Chitinophagaceae bacterium]|nr:MAG: hypothetical protein EOO09_21415 [Chitinophagaceae bacterium]